MLLECAKYIYIWSVFQCHSDLSFYGLQRNTSQLNRKKEEVVSCFFYTWYPAKKFSTKSRLKKNIKKKKKIGTVVNPTGCLHPVWMFLEEIDGWVICKKEFPSARRRINWVLTIPYMRKRSLPQPQPPRTSSQVTILFQPLQLR